MAERPPHFSELVDRYGRELAGPEWGGALSRLTGIHQRTMSRIRAAAAQGREYPPARGVLAALYDALAEILHEIEPHRRPDA